LKESTEEFPKLCNSVLIPVEEVRIGKILLLLVLYVSKISIPTDESELGLFVGGVPLLFVEEIILDGKG